MRKAAAGEADVVVFDLEDAVALAVSRLSLGKFVDEQYLARTERCAGFLVGSESIDRPIW